DDQRRERLGKAMRVSRIVRDAHLRDAGKLRRRRGGGAHGFARDEDVDGAPEFERGGQRTRRHVAQSPARDFRQKKNRHRQITPVSLCNLATSSATDLTLTPALRPPGSAVFK